jgi:hypothetical protein
MLTIDNAIECQVYIRTVKGRCLNEGKAMLICIQSCIFLLNFSFVLKICLIAYEEDDNVAISVLLQFLQPLGHALE